MSRLRLLRVHPWLTGTTAVVVLAGAGLGIYFGTRSSGSAPTAATTVATVTTGTIRQSVSSTGSLAPAAQESLNFAASGEVTSVKVKAGQTVKKGQTLATVESASLSATVAQAEAAVASDKAKVDGDDAVSETQLAADKAALTAAKNQLASAKAELAAATMTSPISGAVAEVNLTVGESVSGNSSSGSNTGSTTGASTSSASSASSPSSSSAQILVISTNSWIVNATVDATSVGLIKTGEQAQLTVTGASEIVYGTIASIGLVSSSSSGTASYPVVIDVTGSPSGLHDGASVTAALIYKQVSNAVVVSTLALHRNASGGQYVEKQVNGKVVPTSVQVGVSSGGQTQITSGLSAGDKIVVPQLQRTTGGTSTGTRGTNGTGTGTFPGRGNFPGGAGGAGDAGGGFGGGGFGG